jgi:hypothetical protein
MFLFFHMKSVTLSMIHRLSIHEDSYKLATSINCKSILYQITYLHLQCFSKKQIEINQCAHLVA